MGSRRSLVVLATVASAAGWAFVWHLRSDPFLAIREHVVKDQTAFFDRLSAMERKPPGPISGPLQKPLENRRLEVRGLDIHELSTLLEPRFSKRAGWTWTSPRLDEIEVTHPNGDLLTLYWQDRSPVDKAPYCIIYWIHHMSKLDVAKARLMNWGKDPFGRY